jgi:hypothetical protein
MPNGGWGHSAKHFSGVKLVGQVISGSVPHQTQFQPPPADVRQHCLSQWATPNTIRQPRDPERRQKVTFRIESAPDRFISEQSDRPNGVFLRAALPPIASERRPTGRHELQHIDRKMDDYGTESDSDYTSYWRDWVCVYSSTHHLTSFILAPLASNTSCLVYLVPWQRILLRD